MCQTPIDEQVRQITQAVFIHHSEGQVLSREIAVALETNQAYIEYLDWLKDNIPPIDSSVIIDVKGTRIKFSNSDCFSDWLAERLI
jgi:hypothetical protein